MLVREVRARDWAGPSRCVQFTLRVPFPIHPGVRMTGSQLEEKPDEMLGGKML